jgi:hypothetical protein
VCRKERRQAPVPGNPRAERRDGSATRRRDRSYEDAGTGRRVLPPISSRPSAPPLTIALLGSTARSSRIALATSRSQRARFRSAPRGSSDRRLCVSKLATLHAGASALLAANSASASGGSRDRIRRPTRPQADESYARKAVAGSATTAVLPSHAAPSRAAAAFSRTGRSPSCVRTSSEVLEPPFPTADD